ncbi:MAG: L-fucose isomerase [Fimbriimonadaceae bacterium]|nr:L-fucose isomerase [Fimbriimonadaceae bacterium]
MPPVPTRNRRPLPRIGIRPTIDGRYGGVRESLEGKVMAMAQSAAALLGTLRHSSGDPVECVVAETCIGGASESARADALFAASGVGATLTVTPCWCYGSETMDMHATRPKAVWGLNGTERPGAVYLAASMAGHAQQGLPAFAVYGRDVQDPSDASIPADVKDKLLRFGRAAIAAASTAGTSYVAIGGTSMGIAGSCVDPAFFRRYLGMRVESVDMSEVARRIEHDVYDGVEYSRAREWVKEHCREGKDWNSPDKRRDRARLDEEWDLSVKMALIGRDLMIGNPRLAELGHKEAAEGHDGLAGGFQGQRQWTDYRPNGDFMEAVLTSSFDWNGRREPFAFATENDSLNAVSMLLGQLLTGTAQLFCDVRTYWSPDSVLRATGYRLSGHAEGGILHLINSGPAALDWARVPGRWWESDPEGCLVATEWCPSITEYFPGGGWSTRFLTPGGIECTMCRLNLVEGLGPVLQIAEGWTVELPAEGHRTLDERTNPTWPTTWFAPRLTGQGAFSTCYDVMAAWGANHGAVCVGHIGADLVALASMLRIPVDRHNLDRDAIFRPASWQRFGTTDAESADFRACSAYGPLFG